MQPLAYLDPDFLDSEEARPIRILAEYLEPLERFKAQDIQDTVVFFGSARIHSREQAEAALQTLMKKVIGKGSAESDEHLLRGRKALEWSRYYEEARELAKVLVIFPGGFGTLDEMFEILTLMQTKKLAKQIQILLYGAEYWDPIMNLEPMREWGAISDHDLSLVQRADTPQHAFELLKSHLTTHHLAPASAQEMKAPGIAKTRS